MDKYEIKTMEDTKFAELKQSKSADKMKIIQGVGTYRMKDNPTYQQLMQYAPPKWKGDKAVKRALVYVDSLVDDQFERDEYQDDVPYLALNLCFIPDDKIESLNFETSQKKQILKI